jgi:hypothetical protein
MEFDEFTIEFGDSLWSDDTYNSKEEDLLLYFCIIYYNELYKCNDSDKTNILYVFKMMFFFVTLSSKYIIRVLILNSKHNFF